MNAIGVKLAVLTTAAFALVVASCRSITPMETVLDEQARSQLICWARNPQRTCGPFGTPASVRTEGRWTRSKWRFSGQVHEKVELLDIGWEAGRRYRYRPVGSGVKRADCTVGFWHRIDGEMIEAGVKTGPDKEACLQLLYPELRLDR